jgi:predicted transcriptional regulator YheO
MDYSLLGGVCQRIDQDLLDKIEAYEGGIPGTYMGSTEYETHEGSGIPDTSSVSTTSTTDPTSSPPPPPPSSTENEEGHNYIRNDGDPSSNSALDLAGEIDSGMDDVFNDFADDEDPLYYEDPETGYWIINEEKLESIYRRLMSYCNLNQVLVSRREKNSENTWMIFEASHQMDLSEIHDKSTSLSQATAKSNQKLIKALQKGTVILMQKIQAHNDATYQDAVERAEAAKGSGWSNFWNSNGDQRRALVIMREANREYKEAMERSLQSLSRIIGGGFVGLTSDIDAYGDGVMNRMVNADDYIRYDDNGYIDTSASKQWIVDLRGEFVGLLNWNRVVVSKAISRESAQKAIFEAVSGKSGQSSRLEGMEETIESENAHQTALFDQTASSVLAVQNLKNQVRYYNKQIQKLDNSRWATVLANIFKAVAAVVALALTVVLCVVSFGTLTLAAVAAWIAVLTVVTVAAGALSAAFNYVAAEIQNAVSDQYTPSLDTFVGPHRNAGNRGKSILDKSDELEYEEQLLLDQIGTGQVDHLGDGYLAVNTERLAILNRQLNGLQNVQRILTKITKQKASSSRLLFRAFTGLSGPRGAGNLFESAMEDALKLGEVQFNALTSMLKEYADSYNIEVQQEHQMKEARTNFWVSLVFAAVGALIAGPFAGIGWTVGQMVGNAISGLINAYRYPTRNLTYEPNTNHWRPVGQEGKGKGGALGVAASMDGFVSDVYSDLFAATCDSGDENIAIDTDRVQVLQKRLQCASVVLTTIASVLESKSRVLKAIWQSMGVVTDEVESMKNLIQANFESQTSTFRLALRMVSEKVQVHNRANAADEQMEQAWVNFGVSIALLAVSAVAGGLTHLVSIFQLGVSLASLAQTVIDFAYTIIRGREDYGVLNKQVDPQEAEERSIARGEREGKTPEWRLLERLEEIESAMQVGLGGGLIEEVGGGVWGINSGRLEVANQRLQSLDQIREIVAEVVAQMKETNAAIARAMGKIGVVSSDSLSSTNYICRTIASSMLQTEMQAVEQYVARHNQMNAADREAWTKGINMGLAAVQTALSLANIKNAITVEKGDKIKANPNSDGLNALETNEYNDAKEISKTIGCINACLSVLQSINELLTGMIFDNSQESKIEHHGENDKIEQKNKEIGTQKRALLNQSGQNAQLNYAEQLGGMEADSVQYALMTGESELDVQFLEILRKQSEELMQSGDGLIKSTSNNLKNVADQKERPEDPTLAEAYGKARQSVEEGEHKLSEEWAGMGTAINNVGVAAQPFIAPPTDTQPGRSSQLILAQIDQLKASLPQVSQESSQVVAQTQALGQDAQVLHGVMVAQHPEIEAGAQAELAPTGDTTSNAELEALQAAIVQAAQIPESEMIQGQINGQPVELEVSLQGVVIHNQDGTTRSLTLDEYVALRVAENPDYQLENDGVYTVIAGQARTLYENVTQAVTDFNDGVSNSQVLANVADMEIPAEQISSGMVKIQEEMKEKLEGRELSDLSPEELQDYYETIYNTIFKPARDQLRDILAERREILAKISECDLSTEEGRQQHLELEVQLSDCMKKEGAVRAQIRGFNQYVGRINNLYKEKTGHDLQPAETSGALVPESSPAETERLSPQIKAWAQTIVAGNLMVDGEGKIVGMLGAEDMDIEDLKQQLEAVLEDPSIDLTPDERNKIEQAVENLTDILGQAPDADSASETAASTSAAATDEVDDDEGLTAEEIFEIAMDCLDKAASGLDACGEQIEAQSKREQMLDSIFAQEEALA